MPLETSIDREPQRGIEKIELGIGEIDRDVAAIVATPLYPCAKRISLRIGVELVPAAQRQRLHQPQLATHDQPFLVVNGEIEIRRDRQPDRVSPISIGLHRPCEVEYRRHRERAVHGREVLPEVLEAHRDPRRFEPGVEVGAHRHIYRLEALEVQVFLDPSEMHPEGELVCQLLGVEEPHRYVADVHHLSGAQRLEDRRFLSGGGVGG